MTMLSIFRHTLFISCMQKIVALVSAGTHGNESNRILEISKCKICLGFFNRKNCKLILSVFWRYMRMLCISSKKITHTLGIGIHLYAYAQHTLTICQSMFSILVWSIWCWCAFCEHMLSIHMHLVHKWWAYAYNS